MKLHLTLTGILLIFLMSFVHAGKPDEQPSEQKIIMDITPITDNLYRYQYHHHVSLFLVTSEGIVLADITNRDAAEWIKAEVKRRFNKPIRFLIYTHEHADHIGGAGAFADDETIIIASQWTNRALKEHSNPASDIPLADITFTGKMTMTVGDKTLELVPVKPVAHTKGVIVVNFVEERTLFAVDMAPVYGVAWMNFSDQLFPEIIDAIKFIEEFDVDYYATGHYPITTKKEIIRHREYLEELKKEVLIAIENGDTLKQAKETIRLDKYKDLYFYDVWMALNVEGAYRSLKVLGTPDEVRRGVRFSSNYEDPENTDEIVVICGFCHGPVGKSLNPSWPNLAGQKKEYLLKSLIDFYKGERFETNMSSVNDYVTEEELPRLAEYYSKLDTPEYAAKRARSLEIHAEYDEWITPVPPSEKDNKVPSGQTPNRQLPPQTPEIIASGESKSISCKACHGDKGIGTSPIFPNIAGQNIVYLIKQLTLYRDGLRVDPVMGPATKHLSDTDIAEIAAYYSSIGTKN